MACLVAQVLTLYEQDFLGSCLTSNDLDSFWRDWPEKVKLNNDWKDTGRPLPVVQHNLKNENWWGEMFLDCHREFLRPDTYN